MLQIVHHYGAIDLSILLLSSPHVFPARKDTELDLSHLGTLRKPGDGPLSIHEAGSLLSYRPARRTQDELIIWNLLLKEIDEPYFNAVEFWKSRQGTTVASGFLISSALRIKAKGLSWAPRSPYALPSHGKKSEPFYRAYDGLDTALAKILPDGIVAPWLNFAFPCMPLHGNIDRGPSFAFRQLPGSFWSDFGLGRSRKKWMVKYPPTVVEELEKIRRRFLRCYRFGVLLQAMSTQTTHATTTMSEVDVAWILRAPNRMVERSRERSQTRVSRYPEIRGTMVVVCGTNGNYSQTRAPGEQERMPVKLAPVDVDWTWRGLHEWPSSVPMPEFILNRNFVIR